jgi:Tol biopolymer transport system component/DNA-binding winged helix-turn-helix (wHTH) protein
VSDTAQHGGRFRFGVFEVDSNAGELYRNGIRLHLQEQPFRVLIALIERPGEIVTREELVHLLWPAGTFVDFDRGLNAAVNRLRQLLGDSADSPRYIETIPRRGYRFLASVAGETGGAPSVQPPRQTLRRLWPVLAVLCSAGLAGYLFSFWSAGSDPVLLRLTSDAGLTTDPAVSPDGTLLAYSSDRNGGNLNLWVQRTGGRDAMQLTHDSADARSPSFSPDGARIVYRSEREGGGIYVVPVLGGEPRRLASGGQDPRYSPDGKWIAYWTGTIQSSAPNAYANGSVYVIGSDGGEARRLGTALVSSVYPIWSPDSRWLLVFADLQYFVGKVDRDWWLIPIDGGEPVRTHVFEALKRQGIRTEWNAEPARLTEWKGESLLFSARSGDSINIWKAGFSLRSKKLTGVPVRLTSGTNFEVQPSWGTNGALMFASLVRTSSVYMLNGDAESGAFRGPERAIGVSGNVAAPSLSEDGRMLAFTNGKESAVYVRDLETGEERKLTDGWHHRAALSRDSKSIAFTFSFNEPYSIYRVPVTGGASTLSVAKGGMVYHWSRDNTRILYRKAPGFRIWSADPINGQEFVFAEWPGHELFQTKFSPDDRWVVIEGLTRPAADSRLYIAGVHEGKADAPASWIRIGFSQGWDDKPRWSPSGNLMYFMSQQDGFRCLWAQRLDPVSKVPRGEPFSVYHFHRARLSMMNVGLGDLEIGVAADKIIVNLGELTGNIWSVRER